MVASSDVDCGEEEERKRGEELVEIATTIMVDLFSDVQKIYCGKNYV
jgi:hypothetical protein